MLRGKFYVGGISKSRYLTHRVPFQKGDFSCQNMQFLAKEYRELMPLKR